MRTMRRRISARAIGVTKPGPFKQEQCSGHPPSGVRSGSLELLDRRSRSGLVIAVRCIATGTLAGVLFLTADGLAPVNLAVIGAPDCFAHVNIVTGSIASLSMSLNTSNQFSVPLVIPNNPVFLATNFHAQTMTLRPGVNALGVQTSNGLCVNVGN